MKTINPFLNVILVFFLAACGSEVRIVEAGLKTTVSYTPTAPDVATSTPTETTISQEPSQAHSSPKEVFIQKVEEVLKFRLGLTSVDTEWISYRALDYNNSNSLTNADLLFLRSRNCIHKNLVQWAQDSLQIELIENDDRAILDLNNSTTITNADVLLLKQLLEITKGSDCEM